MPGLTPKAIGRISAVVRQVEAQGADASGARRATAAPGRGWWGKTITNHGSGRYTLRRMVPDAAGSPVELLPATDFTQCYHASGDDALEDGRIVWVHHGAYDGSGDPVFLFDSFGLPTGGTIYQVLSILSDGTIGWDNVRAHE